MRQIFLSIVSYQLQVFCELATVLCRIIDCDHSTAIIAVSQDIGDVEDALQYYTALKHGVDYFISGDKKLKAVALPQLPVYNAGELLHELANKRSLR